jgi:tetratricopeptide (TPR) repeat protein
VAHVLNTQGLIADARGEYTQAVSLFEASLALWRTLHDMTTIGSLPSNLAIVAYHQQRYAEVVTLLEESLALQRAAHNQWSIAVTLCKLGEVLVHKPSTSTSSWCSKECAARSPHKSVQTRYLPAVEQPQ